MIADDEPFVDHYAILQVDPDCSARELETAYHLLAKRYHPDHSKAADVTRLGEVINAYKALKDPDLRTEYDLLYSSKTGFVFSVPGEAASEQASAISDGDAHARILQFLYKRRRENARDAGVGRYFVQQVLNCTDDQFEFHLWYLKAKRFIEITEEGTLAITIEGVDHVISTSRAAIKEQLLIAPSGNSDSAMQV